MKQFIIFKILFLIFVATTLIAAQDDYEKPFPKVPKIVDKAEDFAPADWKVERVVQGDLNNDGRNDVAMTITNGENGYDEKAQRSSYLTRVLVIAFRGVDGKLVRSAVNADAVYDGDEGGAFGDPFEDLKIERGAVVINHYGGSRNRWGYTHVFRWQQNRWMLIGLNESSMDTADLDYENSQDINLSTGLVEARYSGELNQETNKRIPAKNGSYYELQVIPETAAPILDGKVDASEWQGYSLNLNNKRQVYKGATLWKGAKDLSAKLTAVYFGSQIYLLAEVADNEFTKGDAVRLVNKKGIEIKATETRTTKTTNGYIIELRYAILDIARATMEKDNYALKHLEEVFANPKTTTEIGGATFEAAVEVVDVDAGKQRAVLSTRLAGSPYMGSIRTHARSSVYLTDED